MKIYIAADQTAVNLEVVTHITVARSEGKHIVRINFFGGVARELLFDGKLAADKEYDALIAAMKGEDK
ncbi:hypothetical protein V6U78_12600 [Marinospirillum sp. MEB164]|uniref:Uncharacterized protein n=1 Tax=Marinospirillum alkalitolerans TaxID=3123374 RepID=A0ABW8Q161_9GAMM